MMMMLLLMVMMVSRVRVVGMVDHDHNDDEKRKT